MYKDEIREVTSIFQCSKLSRAAQKFVVLYNLEEDIGIYISLVCSEHANDRPQTTLVETNEKHPTRNQGYNYKALITIASGPVLYHCTLRKKL